MCIVDDFYGVIHLSGGKHQRLMLTQILGVNGPFGAANRLL